MKKIGLLVAAFTLVATWAAPSMAAETEGASAGYDPPPCLIRLGGDNGGWPPGTTIFNPPLPSSDGNVLYRHCAEADDETPAVNDFEACCCAGEDVGEAAQCWDWQCAAAVGGGAIIGGLTGAPLGPWGAAAGALGGGLLGYGTSGACTPH